MSQPLDDFNALFDALARLNGRLREAFDVIYRSSDLAGMERTVLTAVAEAAQPPTVPRIGRSLGHPRQVIQRAANSLIEQGLIASLPNPDHKRAGLLQVTPAGAALHAASRRLAEGVAEGLAATVDRGQVREAVRLLNAIRHDLERPLVKEPA